MFIFSNLSISAEARSQESNRTQVHKKKGPHRKAAEQGGAQCKKNCVTYRFSEGRFGDNLLSYIHAKWVAYHHKVQLLYRPFEYSDQLAMHQQEELYGGQENLGSENNPACFSRKIVLGSGAKVEAQNGKSVLYIVPYFAHCPVEHTQVETSPPFFHVDYNNEGFKAELKKMIQPLYGVKKLEIPKDRITVAVHMRKGTRTLDGPALMFLAPHKEPQDSYYLGQIKRLYALFGNQPMYVHIFTDDPYPREFVEKFQQLLPGLDIQWGAREEGNKHNLNVLDDFFALLDFDCLIRPDSNFSICAELVGSHKVVASPETVAWGNEIPKIGRVNFSMSGEGFD